MDRFDRIIRGSIVFAFASLIVIPFLVIAGLIASYEEPTPAESFRDIVGQDPARYTGIQHFSDIGIDVSHHFRFEFADAADIDALIVSHRLRPNPSLRPLLNNKQPEWYAPDTVPPSPNGRRYSSDRTIEPVNSLFVDYQEKIAYFVYEDF